jgi:hypothetical protein
LYNDGWHEFPSSDFYILLNSIKDLALQKIYITLGPGSYTGLKKARIFLEACNLLNIKTFGYYAYHLITEEMGLDFFVEPAYKNEFFVYDLNAKKHFLLTDLSTLKGSKLVTRVQIPSIEAMNYYEIVKKPCETQLALIEILSISKEQYFREAESDFKY